MVVREGGYKGYRRRAADRFWGGAVYPHLRGSIDAAAGPDPRARRGKQASQAEGSNLQLKVGQAVVFRAKRTKALLYVAPFFSSYRLTAVLKQLLSKNRYHERGVCKRWVCQCRVHQRRSYQCRIRQCGIYQRRVCQRRVRERRVC